MLKLEVNSQNQFLVSGDEPFRVEVSTVNGNLMAFVYRGFEIDPDQEPDLNFDGTLSHNNSLISERPGHVAALNH